MFKQILITLILITLITTFFCINSSKFEFEENKVKYPMKSKFPTKEMKMSELTPEDVFYVNIPWTSTNNNYIHDTLDDKYYIIDIDHYYCISDTFRFKLIINKDINVNSCKIK
jgi:hypothetical protein